MATATIVKVWKDSANTVARIACWVTESSGRVEYIAETPLLKEDGSTKSNVEIKADLTAAVKAVRDVQIATETTIGAITGTVTI